MKYDYSLEKIKSGLAQEINNIVGVDIVQAANIEYPPNQQMGDMSLPCFVLAKNLGKNPAELSTSLTSALVSLTKGRDALFSSIFSSGPYLNFKLNKNNLGRSVLDEIQDFHDHFGHNEQGEGQKTMIEYSNGNSHKECHIGHVRNICYGDSVNRIMNATGFQSIPVSYINDFGIHVAKTLWAYMEYYQDKPMPENKGAFLGQVYIRSNQETEKDPHKKDLINFMMKKIESREGPEYELWQDTRQWSIEQLSNIYQELGINFEKVYYESEVIDQGRELVDDLLEKGILKKSDGAVIADLEDHDLGVLVFLRSDGTATYPVADLALAKRKFDDFDLDASIYVTDNRQELHFKQLFQVLKLMDYKQTFIHLSYDFVTLPDGMMSSRSGNVVTYEELKVMLEEKIKKETRQRHEDWDEESLGRVIKKMTKAVMKFEMLKVGAKQTISFDIEKAMSFQGYTAAYLLYTGARISSIVKKSGLKHEEISTYKDIVLNEEKEHELILKLAKYPDAVRSASQNFDPSIIAKYLFELAQEFNDYYHQTPIIDSPNMNSKLRLIVNLRQVLKNGLELLGIEMLEEM